MATVKKQDARVPPLLTSYPIQRTCLKLHVGEVLTKTTRSTYFWYMKTQVNVKVDTQVKKAAQRKAKELGLSLSAVVNVTLKQFARTGSIDLSTQKYRMTPYLENIVKEARAEYAAGKTAGPFNTAEEFFASLDE